MFQKHKVSSRVFRSGAVGDEPDDSDRRQRDLDRVLLLVPRHLLRLQSEAVADVGAPVEAGVGVQRLAPPASRRQPQPPPLADDRREVARAHEPVLPVLRDAREREDVLVRRVRLEPAEALVRVVELPERGLLVVDAVEIANQVEHSVMVGLVEQVPVEGAGRLAPLLLLCELAAHEQELLAGVSPHVAVESAQVREPLPAVAGHPAEQRALAVNDLVVREGQHEVLVPGVDHREGELVVVEAAVHRLLREVLEGVVHPAHVPLEAEAEAAEVGRARHARPGRGLLGDREDPRLAVVEHLVQLAQEGDRVEILPAAEGVRHPFARLP